MNGLLDMGGYGGYVWSSFALTLIVLVLCIAQGRRRHRMICRDITLRLKAMEAPE